MPDQIGKLKLEYFYFNYKGISNKKIAGILFSAYLNTTKQQTGRPLFPRYYEALRVVLHLPVSLWRTARFFSKAFPEMAHLMKPNGGSNIPDRLICLCELPIV